MAEADGGRVAGRDSEARAGSVGVDIDAASETEAQDDEALLTLAAIGDRYAFVELYRRHEALCWAVARTATDSNDAAAAAVADAFVRLLGAAVPSPSLGVRAFLCTLVQREIDARRARSRSRPRASSHGDEPAEPGAGDDDRPEGDGRAEHDAAAGASPEAAAGQEVSDATPNQGDDDILWRALRSVVPPPPPELWALVQVAWDDKSHEQPFHRP